MSTAKKILLTGASGFLGKIIHDYLITELSCNVVTVGRNRSSDVHFDISDNKAVLNLAAEVDTVIHAAGKAHSVPKTDLEEQEFIAVNYEGTKNLCNNLEKGAALPKQFVFISTVAVYGADHGELITEQHALNGNTPYALSKIKAEEFLVTWAKKNNVSLTILRLPLVAGPNAPGNLGAMIDGINSGKYFSIGKADARKSVIWAEDVARVIPMIAEIGGIFNITDGIHPTFKQLETVIALMLKKAQPVTIPFLLAYLLGLVGNLLGKNAPINSEKLKKITSTLTFDDQKLRNVINWTPSSVVEKLSKTI